MTTAPTARSTTQRTARDVMTRNVALVRADQTLREAAALLTECHISGAPVVDRDGRLVGVLSESDLLSDARRDAAIARFAVLGPTPVPAEPLRPAPGVGWNLRAGTAPPARASLPLPPTARVD